MNEFNAMNQPENEATNELVLVKNVMPALISFNYEDLEKALNNKLVDYQNLVVTEDTLKGAKNSKKELASLRNDLDAFRKAAKKEAEKPIKEFEGKIKKLIALVEETEKPLDESINVYDEQVREEKRAYAKNLIEAAIVAYELRPEYAARMILKDEYANLSGTKKSVKESISKQAELLKYEQDTYDSNVNIVNAAVEQENKRIKVKLRAEKFTSLLGSVDTAEIISLIKEQAYDIYQQENPKEDIAVDVTALFEPKADNTTPDTFAPCKDGELSPDSSIPGLDEMKNDAPVIPDCFIAPTGSDVNDDFIPVMGMIPGQMDEFISGQITETNTSINENTPPIITPMSNENDWECVFKVIGDFTALRGLNAYMKEHGIHFEVISQKKVIDIA